MRHRSQPGVLSERSTFLILRGASQAKLPGRPGTGRVVKDSGEWLALLPGRLPGHITAEEHKANVAPMAANRQAAASPGAPRNGAALLAGLVRCGRCCGHRMTVRYHDGPRSGARSGRESG